jgi:hypothetical protein
MSPSAKTKTPVAPRKPPGRPPWRIEPRSVEIILAIAGAAFVFVLYHRIIGQYLYNDDFEWISNARYDMHPGNVLGFRVVNFFRPFINVVFFVQEHLLPDNIRLYYLENIALHFGNTVLAYLLIKCLFGDRRVAACAALLFLVTSTHQTAVIWISARTTLYATFFLLLSLVILTRRSRCSLALALVAYFLALMSKETATAGFLLVCLLFFYGRGERHGRATGNAVAAFGAVTALYMIVRLVVIGRFTQSNWAPGLHVLRNVAGGFLYEVYPWWLTSLTHVGRTIHESTRPVWPEVLAIPVIAALVGVASLARRSRQMSLLIAWALIGLLPASLFTFRFFSTRMVTQDRYYYLSSLGVCAALALLLVALWDTRRWRVVARAAVVAVLATIVVGEFTQVSLRNRNWSRMTGNYRDIVGLALAYMDDTRDLSVCVVQEPIVARPYIMDGLRIERPKWHVMPVESREEALNRRPCVYVEVRTNGNRVGVRSTTLR